MPRTRLTSETANPEPMNLEPNLNTN
jgi:hypothetical protein